MLIDTHSHLDFPQFDADREAVLARANDNGVRFVVNVGSSLAGSRAAVAMAQKYSQLYAVVGIHPHEADACGEAEVRMIEELAKQIGTQMIYFVPRDNMVQRAEINRKTVIDFDPACGQADHYRSLAKAIDGNDMFVIPKPLNTDQLEKLLIEFGLNN